MQKYPALFVSHGSPLIAIEEDHYTAALKKLGEEFPKPKTIVIVSAHWEAAAPISVNTGGHPGMIYDFGGFPDEMYALQYPAPGNPSLALEIIELLKTASLDVQAETRRGFDHGVWTPLLRIFPKADVPIVQISLPIPRNPAILVRVGQALSSLRTRGVLLVGSGGIVHNLRKVKFGAKEAPVDAWAQQFDDWVWERVQKNEVAELMAYRTKAPHADLAVPESEHLDPLFFTLGAASGEPATSIYAGFHYGNLSMRIFTVGKS